MNKYTLIERLGAGTFGTVHLAESKETGKRVVVKENGSKHQCISLIIRYPDKSLVLILKKQIRVSGLSEARREKVLEESRLLSCLRDVSIVR